MDQVIAVINRSNQRGGRMLSIIDLIAAGTITREQAAWLAVRILEGSSFLVGATPGGAGKTTVMGALLGLLPADTSVHLTTNGSDWRSSRRGDCVVAYELSPGFYDAYVWGEDLRDFVRLGMQGCRIVSNLHADTVDEAREQIVTQCGATYEELAAFEIFLPIRTGRSFVRSERVVDRIYAVREGRWCEADVVVGPRERTAAAFFDECISDGVRNLEHVRQRWLAEG